MKSFRALCRAIAGPLLRGSVIALLILPATPAGDSYLLYVGTYTGPKSKGIYAFNDRPAAAKFAPLGLAAEVVRPSWVLPDAKGRFLYAVSELGNDGKTEGIISSFTIDRATGSLRFVNKVPSGGGGACHLAIDRTGKTLFVANYGSGSVAALRLQPDGSIGDRRALIQHHGSSVNPKRQRGPHAHAVVLSPDNRFLFVPDLGLDRILSYRFDSNDSSLVPNDPPFAAVKPGSGPRHFAFHPSGRFAYVINEMGSSVTAFAYDPKGGVLTELATETTLPPDFRGENNSAELEIDKGGRFLYASNRGDNSIAVFAIDRSRGGLHNVQRVSTAGKTPRNIRIDPTGNYLLAANQDSDSIVVFTIDRKNGTLTSTGQTLEAGSPVCLQFVSR